MRVLAIGDWAQRAPSTQAAGRTSPASRFDLRGRLISRSVRERVRGLMPPRTRCVGPKVHSRFLVPSEIPCSSYGSRKRDTRARPVRVFFKWSLLQQPRLLASPRRPCGHHGRAALGRRQWYRVLGSCVLTLVAGSLPCCGWRRWQAHYRSTLRPCMVMMVGPTPGLCGASEDVFEDIGQRDDKERCGRPQAGRQSGLNGGAALRA